MIGCASIQARKANRGAGFLALLVAALLAISGFGQTQPHSPPSGHTARPTPASSLQQAEELIQEGRLD